MKTITSWLLGMITAGSTLVPAANIARAAAERPDLNGTVAYDDGTPVTNATVFVYTARPRSGQALTCPSCYPDCEKRAPTSSQGGFLIKALDPALIFRLLVVAPESESEFISNVDPLRRLDPVILKHWSEEKLKSRSRIAGQVIDPSGKPIAGATIGPEGVSSGSRTSWGGTERFVEPLAVTDEHGRFRLFCKDTVDSVHAVVEGRSVAKRWVELKPGRDHLIRMAEGVTVAGRLHSNGQPLPGVVVGLVTKDWTCGSFLRGEQIVTGKEGYFLFPNVTADRDFVLYAKMESMPAGTTLPSQTFNTGRNGLKRDLGILETTRAFRVAGRIILPDNERIPPDTRFILGREAAWDNLETSIDDDGKFEFVAVPAESVGLHLRIPGYKFSKRNASLDWLNGGLVGRVDGHIPDLTLLMEPGEWRLNGEEGEPPNGTSQPRDQPLRGIKP